VVKPMQVMRFGTVKGPDALPDGRQPPARRTRMMRARGGQPRRIPRSSSLEPMARGL
jgi:hypothetical protein